MNMVIVIEIVVGIFVLAWAVMFAVRDTRQRRSVSLEQESGPEDVREVQASVSGGDVEKRDDAEKRDQSRDPSVGVDA